MLQGRLHARPAYGAVAAAPIDFSQLFRGRANGGHAGRLPPATMEWAISEIFWKLAPLSRTIPESKN